MHRQLEERHLAVRTAQVKTPAVARHAELTARIGNQAVGRLLRETGEQTLEAAVARAVQASARTSLTPLQRCGATPPEQCLCHGDGEVAAGMVQRDATEARGAVKALERAERGERRPQPCLPASGTAEPFMPTTPSRLPIKLGTGTFRNPKLKAPYGPSGSKCREACGPDCPDSCEHVGTYEESYSTADGCNYVIEFPNALKCGTHEACRAHDADFDIAESQGESAVMGPQHAIANTAAYGKALGVAQSEMGADKGAVPLGWRAGEIVKSWASGGGPYDGDLIFVDQPVIKSSSGSTTGGAPESYQQVTGSLYEPSAPPSRRELKRAGPSAEERRRAPGEVTVPLVVKRW